MRYKDRPLPRGISSRVTKGGEMFRARVTYQGHEYQVGEYFTVGDAKAAIAIARSQIARETFVPVPTRRSRRHAAEAAENAQSLTVREWSERWLAALQSSHRSPGTITSYRSTLRKHVLPILGDMRLVDVKPENIEGLTAGVSDGVSYNIAAAVSAMFNAAVKAKAGDLAESPVTITAASYSTKRRQDEADAATVAEVRAMAGNMPARLLPSVWLAATCALRLGEVLGLQRRDLDLEDQDNAVLHVRRQWLTKASPPAYAPPKVGSARVVAIPRAIVPMLTQHLASNVPDAPESPVFASTVDRRRPISQGSFDRAWRLAREPVRPGFRFHALRHVGLTWYAQQGATTEELLRRGGHTSVEVAQRYQSATAARDRTLTDKLDGELEKALG